MTPSRKRPADSAASVASPSLLRRRVEQQQECDAFVTVLAESGCKLLPEGPLLVARDLQQRIDLRLKGEGPVHAEFLAGLQSHISDVDNLHRLLLPMAGNCRGIETRSCDSLARVLLSVASIQTAVANILLEKLPEHVMDSDRESLENLAGLMDSIPRLILSQFRWLDFLVDSQSLTEKLLAVLSICPLGLKKEIILFLPEVIVDSEHEMVMQALEQMLEEDLQLILPVLEVFSNLNLEEDLHEQVVNLALGSLRTADAEDLPLVVRFLLQSATNANVRQIVQQLREHLHFISLVDVRSANPDRKQKGKSTDANCDTLILDAIRSGLRFKNLICEAILKEIRNLEGESNHKVVDVWLLVIIHANGPQHRKVSERLFKRKVVGGDIKMILLQQCLHGHAESHQEYFKTLVTVSESLLRSNEVAAHHFGTHTYVLLFKEFGSSFHRQEVIGSLITHTGSGISHEVGAALDTLLLLATEYTRELLPISSFMNGILDYLEGFQDTHLNKVYRVFSHMALVARSSGRTSSSASVADDLLMIVRKQISHPDLKYKRMGIIGAVGLISCFGQGNSEEGGPHEDESPVLGPSIKEALTILQMISDSCKMSPAARAFFYDELAAQVETLTLHASIIEWISVQMEEFSTVYLGDLEEGQVQVSPDDCGLLQGQVWMNLDGSVSPIILNVLPMLTLPNSRYSSLQPLLYLPANIRLLAAVERKTNQGSLGGIDALLGCPLYLPKSELFLGETWKSLSRRHKELSCFSLFYSINWIRELLNAFSTQLEARLEDSCTQLTKEEMTEKLLKRLRNLILLERLLNACLKAVPYLSFPQLHSLADAPAGSKVEGKIGNINKIPPKAALKKKGQSAGKKGERKSKENGRSKTVSDNTQDSQASGRNRQPTIQDALGRAAGESDSQRLVQGEPTADVSTPNLAGSNIPLQASPNGNPTSEAPKETGAMHGLLLDEQRWKFRPINLACMTILATPKGMSKMCCSDPAAQLPLHLYLLEDLRIKLDACLVQPTPKHAPWLVAAPARKVHSGLEGMLGPVLLERLQPLFPSLKKHLDSAVDRLCLEGDITACEEHWNNESVAAGNPATLGGTFSGKSDAHSVFMVTLHCVGKILAYRELALPGNLRVLKDLLLAFSSVEGANQLAGELLPKPTPSSLDHAMCGTYAYFDSLYDAAAAVSLSAATELMVVLKALVNCAQACLDQSTDERRRHSSPIRLPGLLPFLHTQLSNSAGRVLAHDWDAFEPWKSKGDVLQQLLRMLIQSSESPVDLLQEMACTVLPQVSSKGGRSGQGSIPGYPALCPTTFVVWYRVQHEEVLSLFNRVMKEVLVQSKLKTSLNSDSVVKLLTRTHQCITVHASLVNLTKTHDKSAIHAVAVKFGGKFMETFLKGMEFFQVQYEDHKDAINSLVKELQKATRIIQTLCSEAKGQKKMPVACKVPAVKRAMERFVFCMKALLHGASHGSSFWMGNLKHKNLQGHEVSSQLYASDDDEQEEEEEQQEHESEGDGESHASSGEDEG